MISSRLTKMDQLSRTLLIFFFFLIPDAVNDSAIIIFLPMSDQVPSITARGVQLAAIFMRGVEAALLANDASGAPIPWELCCPWLYFDGKLFQYKLHRAMTGSNLRDLCDGKVSNTNNNNQ